MMAVEVGARPALAEIQQRLLAIHATLLSHRATNRFIAPIGRPQPAPCLQSHAITVSAELFHSVSGSGSCASCSTDVGLSDGADERPSSGCATANETAAGAEDASTERDAPSTSEASEHVLGPNRRHSSVAGAVDGQVCQDPKHACSTCRVFLETAAWARVMWHLDIAAPGQALFIPWGRVATWPCFSIQKIGASRPRPVHLRRACKHAQHACASPCIHTRMSQRPAPL